MRAVQALGYLHAVMRSSDSSAPSAPAALSRRRILHLGAAGLLVAAGRASAQPAAVERRGLTLAVGGKTSLPCLPLTIAEQLGYFRDEGVQVELQDHPGGGLAQQALLQGRADVAVGGLEHPIMLRQRGSNCRAFVQLGRAPQLVFGVSTRALPEFRALAQLRGRRVGITSTDSSSHWFAQRLLARAGLASTEVEFVAVGTASTPVAALREGRIDALADIDPAISLLEYRGDIRVVADTRSLRGTQEVYGGPMPGACLYAPDAFVLRYPQTVQALANAVVRALKWLQTAGPSDIVRVVPESHMHGDRSVYLSALDKAREAMSPDGVASDEGVAIAHRIVTQHLQAGANLRVTASGASHTNDFARRARQKYLAP